MSFNYGAFWEDLIEDLADPEFREAFIDISILFMRDYHEEKLEEEQQYTSYEDQQRQTHDEWRDATGRKFWVHKRNVGCDVDGCAIHNPSYHPLSNAKQYMRADKAWLIERICDHGIGHPDPDSASFISKQEGNGSIWVHGCDGCCKDPEPTPPRTQRSTVKRGWGPHEHRYVWADDGIGHSGAFCSCGKEEPNTY